MSNRVNIEEAGRMVAGFFASGVVSKFNLDDRGWNCKEYYARDIKRELTNGIEAQKRLDAVLVALKKAHDEYREKCDHDICMWGVIDALKEIERAANGTEVGHA